MSSSLAKSKESLKNQIITYGGEFEKILPPGVTFPEFERMAMTAVTRNPDILKCTQKSIIGALFTCAQLGLSPDTVRNEAHLVPFGDKCALVPGYKGLEQLCINSGKVERMVSRAVYENDDFDYMYGTDGTKWHHKAATADRGEPIGAYDVATMTSGREDFLYLTKADIERHRKRSPMGKFNKGAWKTDYPKMAMKTVKREHAKQLPMSAKAQTAVALDELAEAGIDQKLESNIPDCRTLDPDDYEVEGGGKSKDFAFFREIDGLLRLLRVEVGKQGMEDYYRSCLKSLGVEHRDEILKDSHKKVLKGQLRDKIIEEKLLTVAETEPVTVEGLNRMRDIFREFDVEFDDVIDNDEAYLQAVQNRAHKTAAWRVHELWTGGGDE